MDGEKLNPVIPGNFEVHGALLETTSNADNAPLCLLQPVAHALDGDLDALIGKLSAVLGDPMARYQPLVRHPAERTPQRVDHLRQERWLERRSIVSMNRDERREFHRRGTSFCHASTYACTLPAYRKRRSRRDVAGLRLAFRRFVR